MTRPRYDYINPLDS